jgi:hypothetical protein
MAGRYAARTEVDSARSRVEIERTLERYGADQFAYGTQPGSAMIGFRLKGRMIRFTIPMPLLEDFRYTEARGYERTDKATRDAWEQATRQKWRALALVIKAKLEAVEAGITDVESEFLAATMLPNGETVGDWIEPQIQVAYETGGMPALLPAMNALPPGDRR